jgi:hypothetical protein
MRFGRLLLPYYYVVLSFHTASPNSLVPVEYDYNYYTSGPRLVTALYTFPWPLSKPSQAHFKPLLSQTLESSAELISLLIDKPLADRIRSVPKFGSMKRLIITTWFAASAYLQESGLFHILISFADALHPMLDVKSSYAQLSFWLFQSSPLATFTCLTTGRICHVYSTQLVRTSNLRCMKRLCWKGPRTITSSTFHVFD